MSETIENHHNSTGANEIFHAHSQTELQQALQGAVRDHSFNAIVKEMVDSKHASLSKDLSPVDGPMEGTLQFNDGKESIQFRLGGGEQLPGHLPSLTLGTDESPNPRPPMPPENNGLAPITIDPIEIIGADKPGHFIESLDKLK